MASQADIELHYDLNQRAFFEKLLGPSMTYSSADWSQCTTLEEAQHNKYKKMARFAGVNEKTSSVVDLGCGWGENLRWVQTHFPNLTRIDGVTLSYEQAAYIAEKTPRARSVEVYERDVFEYLKECSSGTYDAAISIGAFEHFASPKHYRTNTHIQRYRQFFSLTHSCVTGNLGLQTIVALRQPNSLQGAERMRAMRFQYFIAKYIFPNALTPRLEYIEAAIDGLYEKVFWELRGDDYAKTLCVWRQNLVAHRGKISKDQYDLFMRYLDLCIEHFLSGYVGLARLSLAPIR